MAYVSLNNFKFGLDSRRSELSSVQGTLQEALDGHITQGAEFEKRKAYTELNNTSRPSNTFGLEVTSTGLVVFGSVVATGEAVAGTTLFSISEYAGVYYQRLQHPSVLFGNVTPPAMTALVLSTSFGGKTWAAATFDDGYTYLYYDGTPIPGSYNGLVLTGANSLQNIATQLATYVATITGFTVGAVTSSGGSYYFDMWSAPGLSFSLTVNNGANNTGSGVVSENLISSYTTGTAGASATTSFTITGGSFYNGISTSGITNIEVFDAVTAAWVNVLPNTIYFQSGNSLNDFAANVISAINSNTNILNISAQVTNSSISLSFPLAVGDTPNGYALRVYTIGDTCVDNTVFNFSAYTTLANGTTCTSIQVPSQVNLVPGAAAYSGGGSYVLSSHITFTNGKYYDWVPGANDISISNGVVTLTSAGSFQFTTGQTVTMVGAASTTITANVLLFIEILGTTITSTTNLTSWVNAIAAGVRAFCISNGLNYTAYSTGSAVVISRTHADSSLPFGNGTMSAIITVSAGTIIDGSSGTIISAQPLSLAMAPSPASETFTSYSTLKALVVNAGASGGTPPYSYNWSPLGTQDVGQGQVSIKTNSDSTLASQATVVLNSISGFTTISFTLTCTITDSNGVITTSSVNVIFTRQFNL